MASTLKWIPALLWNIKVIFISFQADYKKKKSAYVGALLPILVRDNGTEMVTNVFINDLVSRKSKDHHFSEQFMYTNRYAVQFA